VDVLFLTIIHPKDLKRTWITLWKTLQSLSRGYLIVAALIEMNSNFSSLLYDKTKASFEDYVYADYGNKIPKRNLNTTFILKK